MLGRLASMEPIGRAAACQAGASRMAAGEVQSTQLLAAQLVTSRSCEEVQGQVSSLRITVTTETGWDL